MATHAGEAPTGKVPRHTEHPAAEGWTVFAAVLMIFGGIMAIFEGASAIAKDTVFINTPHYVYSFNLTGWGILHLILGILVALAGVALFTGAVWARILGVTLAGLSMIANFIWLPHFPLWAIVVIAIDAFVIWALCTSSRDLVGD
ncbi:DUF7144 family membrane protein [Streptomyces chattanoogensis]|uniref:Membrane protein n=1 Tax=Streptomyces chattanoogensis TaxID=66876 RepID=A0A0N0XWX1_9ACTN|nr:hypothetical protein [Streptomyces chattanoogensis]KPC62766.1 membrane protein [Streptomyces chattanoogensis]